MASVYISNLLIQCLQCCMHISFKLHISSKYKIECATFYITPFSGKHQLNIFNSSGKYLFIPYSFIMQLLIFCTIFSIYII